ncbi:ABC transporter substrate-binding protein [Leptolyngbya ohadii]|uniref:ABC transporter substrate-binding protein n=1 Tax=Leptolyngbya ohadii TaxID=1962290 RepID=UPI000B59AEF0|nr:ABC transporter substrate-binding protein [Leptolyngbya ohadii]
MQNPMQRRDFLKWASLFSASAALPNLLAACNTQPSDQTNAGGNAADTKPLTVGVQPWAGFLGQYIALDRNFFSAEGVTVKEEYFQVATDTNTALAAGRVDLAWVGIPDLMTLVAQNPSLKILMVSDYSNGADGILGRNLSRASDLRGKKVAREDAPYAKIFLGSYLKQAGLSEKDVEVVSLSASDAATAFAAGQVDAATTYEPWLSKIVQEGKGQIIFTSKDTNIIPNGLAASAEVIASRRDDIVKYLRAIDRALAFSRTNASEANEICAKKLGVTAAEIPPQLAGIRVFDVKGNQDGPMNLDSPYSLVRSLQSGEQIITSLGLTSKPIDAAQLVDDSLVKSL